MLLGFTFYRKPTFSTCLMGGTCGSCEKHPPGVTCPESPQPAQPGGPAAGLKEGLLVVTMPARTLERSPQTPGRGDGKGHFPASRRLHRMRVRASPYCFATDKKSLWCWLPWAQPLFCPLHLLDTTCWLPALSSQALGSPESPRLLVKLSSQCAL